MNRLRWLAVIPLAALMIGYLSARVNADDRPLMRVTLLPELIPGVVQQLIPMPLELAGGKAQIVSLVYCGADGRGGANALGIVAPDQTTPLPGALSQSDCAQPLPALAGRTINMAGAPDWIEVVKARVTWAPWQLSLDLSDHAGAAKPGRNAPSIAGLRQLGSYPTSNLKILPPPGDNDAFDAALGFGGSTIIVAIFANGHVSNPKVYLTIDAALGAQISSAPAQANIMADAQYTFINALLKMYAPQYELPIPIQGMTQTMTVRNVRVSGADNVMSANGQIESGALAYNGTVRSEGPDLTIRQITLDPITANCESDDMIEKLKCAGQQAALSGSSSAVAAGLTNYYQGQNFHYSAVDHPLQFTLGDRQFSATFEAMRSHSQGSMISETGRVSIQRIGGR